MRDTQCSACGKWMGTLSSGSVKMYCDDSCRNRAGVPGRGQRKRELRVGEIVQPYHQTLNGTLIGERFYLVGRPYPGTYGTVTPCYTIEDVGK
jgi:hypothetical protein